MFSYRIFRQDSDVMLAVCDYDILGKTFGSGDVQITVSDFYSGDKCGGDILKIAEGATIINAVGNRIVRLLIEKGLVEESSVMKIGDVAHAQVISVSNVGAIK